MNNGPPSARGALRSARPGPPPSVRDAVGTVEPPAPTREVAVDDRVWVVRQNGSARVGHGRGPGLRIISVGVEAGGDGEGPDGGDAPNGAAARYVLAQSLTDVPEDELAALVREAIRAPEPDADSRAGGGRRRRGRRSHGYRGSRGARRR